MITNKIYFYYIFSGLEPGEADQEDGELGDDSCDDDGEADGAVPVPLEEGHQEPKSGKQHHVDVNYHWKRK